ncbi:response regulator [Paraburkholderia sp. BCC1886]|uniref:response regulator n=1 Tax=Paraburkholderia sp. BCC1886 TaxID=2562670 RepID=UPI0016423948|nr:response regulator [Paraburkholderia sp. BCC1886]
MNVLFVDDNRASADALAALAVTMGHQASVAYDGHSAADIARTTAFDLILLDLKLGESDGREVCANIRREGASRHSHILAMTGYVGLEQGVSLGDFNGYVLKPLRFDRLEDLLTG